MNMAGPAAVVRGRASGPLIAIGLLTLFAAYRFAQPVSGDQAFGIIIGQRIRNGAVVYRDVWDIRQPFSYYWYAAVGWLFGAGTVGLRIGELLWQAALAWLIAHDCITRGGTRRLAIVTACACVAPIFVITVPNDVAQPETLIAFPLYLALRAVALPGRQPLRPRTALALGVGTIGIALFKILYAPIPLLLVSLWVIHHRPARGEVLRAARWYILGVVASTALVIAYFAQHGVLGWVVHTWFVQGPAMRRITPPPLRRLVFGGGRLLLLCAPLTVATLVGLRRLRRCDLWQVSAAVWLVAAGLILLPQQWWAYSMLSLITPAGLLAADTISEWVRTAPRMAIAAAVVAALAIASDREYAGALLRHGPSPSAIAHDMDPAESDRDHANRLLTGSDHSGLDVYGFCNPTILLDLPVAQHISIHGWSPEFYDDTTWARLQRELAADPPTFIIVDEFSGQYVRDRAPAIWAWLTSGYDDDGQLAPGLTVLRHRGG